LLTVGRKYQSFRVIPSGGYRAISKQIEILNCKVAALQQKLQGDLVEPEYGQFGFDQNGRIANAIAEWLWNHHKIPLKVTGFRGRQAPPKPELKRV
jgi:hypothetical protein